MQMVGSRIGVTAADPVFSIKAIPCEPTLHPRAV